MNADTPNDNAVSARISAGRTLLCVLDDTPEVSVALQFAARRARRTGAHIGLLYVIEGSPEFQLFSSIGDLMRAEANAKAEQVLMRGAEEVLKWKNELPIFYIREGNTRDEVISQIKEDSSISFLILGAATGRDGPGPLVTALAGKSVGQLHVPIVIVPGNMSEEEIASFA